MGIAKCPVCGMTRSYYGVADEVLCIHCSVPAEVVPDDSPESGEAAHA